MWSGVSGTPQGDYAKVPDGSGVDSDEAAPPEAHHGHLRPDRSLEAVSGAASEEGGLLRALHRRHRRALPVHSGGGEALPHAAERLYQVGPPEQRGGRARIPVWQHGSSPRFQAPCPRAAQPKPADEHDVDLGTLGTARSSAKADCLLPRIAHWPPAHPEAHGGGREQVARSVLRRGQAAVRRVQGQDGLWPQVSGLRLAA
mmetsp:Transcript_4766/g.19095  ORF Transcript_4766/g.19095 Transcript_4766/m.19095 type:complete len:201 (+) Transcript_4766:467-1069(+)